MTKRVTLTLMEGSFEQGFPVILRIKEVLAPTETQIQASGKLPPAPIILELLNDWQNAYRQIVMHHSRMKANPAQVTNISCIDLGSRLEKELNIWLNSGFSEWQKLRDILQQNLNRAEEIQVIIETNDSQVRQLPWNQWNLFSRVYTQAEVALSLQDYQHLTDGEEFFNEEVRILAILGDSTGIDVQKDRKELKKLPGVKTTLLEKPSRQELNDQLWQQKWTILFFAGHSCSHKDGNSGKIQINPNDSLSLSDLRNALQEAIARGLQIAIFNSCSGLGLARELADLHIPQIIVMREPVPDFVAQEFLKNFLEAFTSGKSLYLAVREAREKLQGIEDKFLYASWLPVICQNPAVMPLIWHNPLINRSVTRSRDRLLALFLASLTVTLLVTLLVMGLRWLGRLQPWELQTYDQLMELRPDEGTDPRLLIVEIPEDYFQSKDHPFPLRDETMLELLQKLEQYQPKVIGFDIYRNKPQGAGHDELVKYDKLVKYIQQYNNIVPVCMVPSKKNTGERYGGVEAPIGVEETRSGFGNVVKDPDGIIRRYLVSMNPDPSFLCPATYALSFNLAWIYLDGKDLQFITPNHWKLNGKLDLIRLSPHTGFYHQVDLQGFQVLLNYRQRESLTDVAERVTLTDVFNNRVKADSIRGKIVLIGVNSSIDKDDFKAPLNQDIRGLYLHAQMVSQMISGVKDSRLFLWFLPTWGDVLFIWLWSTVGSVFALCCRSLLYLGLAQGIALITLSAICFIFLLTTSVVLPLIPSALVLVATGGCLAVYTASQNQRQN